MAFTEEERLLAEINYLQDELAKENLEMYEDGNSQADILSRDIEAKQEEIDNILFPLPGDIVGTINGVPVTYAEIQALKEPGTAI